MLPEERYQQKGNLWPYKSVRGLTGREMLIGGQMREICAR